ncbi:MAG TPA: nicotinic acid mononucleotide adenylyltransferase, partial [Syntrophomonas sp.]|nr:nicotinic acid mononucleotide adenylyltransferase [Syntrophomonas sp.]
ARHEFKLDRVIFMPAARPPHKEIEEVLDSEYRYNMVKLAIQGNPAFAISDLEMKRTGKSYTIDTIRYFLEHYPGSDIYFIMGADSLLMMDTWKDYQELSGLCRFVVVTRPGYVIERSDPVLKNLPSILWERMEFLPIPGLDISSTDIRQRVAESRPVKYLLPLEVERYILDQGLYR